jgi:hypothetical protein
MKIMEERMNPSPVAALQQMTNGALKRSLQAVILQDKKGVDELSRRLGTDIHTTQYLVISTAAQRWMDMIPDGVE